MDAQGMDVQQKALCAPQDRRAQLHVPDATHSVTCSDSNPSWCCSVFIKQAESEAVAHRKAGPEEAPPGDPPDTT